MMRLAHVLAVAFVAQLGAVKLTARARHAGQSRFRGWTRFVGGKINQMGEMKELLDVIAKDIQQPMPFAEFEPLCLAHVQRLLKTLDSSYTDSQLEHILIHECGLVKEFPSVYSHGYKSHEACQSFSRKLLDARMLELKSGSIEGEKEFCAAYHAHVVGSSQALTVPEGDATESAEPEASNQKEQDTAAAVPDPQKLPPIPEGEAEPAVAEKADGAPTKEPPFVPVPPGAEDERVAKEMSRMKDQIDKEIKSSDVPPGNPQEEAKPAPAVDEIGPPPKSDGAVHAAPPKQPAPKQPASQRPMSQQDLDYINDDNSYDRVAKQVAAQGGGPGLGDSEERKPLPDWAVTKVDESRRSREEDMADAIDREAAYEASKDHWSNMRERTKRRLESEEAEAGRTNWEIMRDRVAKRRGAEDGESYGRQGEEWENTEIEQRRVRPTTPKPPGAAATTSPFLVLTAISVFLALQL